jgi:hypothetical protein
LPLSTIDIQKIIRQQLYVHELDNLEETNKFLVLNDPQSLNQEKIGYTSGWILSKKTESLTKSFSSREKSSFLWLHWLIILKVKKDELKYS